MPSGSPTLWPSSGESTTSRRRLGRSSSTCRSRWRRRSTSVAAASGRSRRVPPRRVVERSSGSTRLGDRATGPPTATGRDPAAVVVTGGSVWVANRGDDTVSRVDAATRSVEASIPVGDEPALLSAGGGSVWVANLGDNTLMRIDAATGAVRGAPISLGKEIDDLAVSERAVWVAAADGTVTRLDPVSGEVVGSPLAPARAPLSLALDGGTLWVGSVVDRTLQQDRGGRRMSQSAGSRLGPYVVGGLVAAGSSGEWFDGSEVSLERPVSVLVVPLPQDAESAATLRERARGLASLTDARLLPVYAQGEEGTLLWLATRKLDGRLLSEIDRLEPDRAARLGSQLAAQLAALDESGASPEAIPAESVMLEGDCRRRTSLASSGPARRGLGRRVLGDELARLASRQPRRRPAPRRPPVRPAGARGRACSALDPGDTLPQEARCRRCDGPRRAARRPRRGGGGDTRRLLGGRSERAGRDRDCPHSRRSADRRVDRGLRHGLDRHA